jgi:hypothetical protein
MKFRVTNDQYSSEEVVGTLEELQRDFDEIARDNGDWADVRLVVGPDGKTLRDAKNNQIVGEAV